MTKQPEAKHGHPPLHRIPVVDHEGNMRGHVGKTATGATVARFLGRHGAKIGKHEGRTAWIGAKPPPPPPPPPLPGMPPLEAAKGEAEIGLINARRDALIRGAKSDQSKPKAKAKK